ncbi:MAG TPA: extracellular solute-binding protein [Mobilitalea sp.]|nr:extracellular solute-binding protein [Mobilitalea sp.]
MYKVKRVKRLIAIALMIALSLSGVTASEYKVSAKTNTSLDQYKELLSETSQNGIDYKDYIAQYDTTKRPNKEYDIEAKDYVRSDGMDVKEYQDYEGMEGTSVYTGEKGLIEYEVNIKEEGFYDLSLLYYPIEGKSASIQRGIFIDGTLPYNQLNLVEFSRIWVNAVDQWERDNRGNDLKPQQIEAPAWTTSYLYDSEGYETDRLSVYLTPGVHTITFYSRREPMLLRKIVLNNTESVKTYSDIKSELDAQGIADTSGQMIKIDAEEADRKSSQMLYPTQDKSSPAVYPYSAKELKNNTIGSNGNWRIVGQWLEWDFDVKESGYYYITLHSKQNFVRGIYSSRKITIDGETPFKEMEDYGFKYKANWAMTTLSDDQGQAYKFYLEAGKHTMRMEVVLGDFSDIVSDVQDIVQDLNSVYRKIIRITGVDPDQYRDYNLEGNIPGLAEELTGIRDRLSDATKRLTEVAGKGSNREAVLKTMVVQLNDKIKDVERFTKTLHSFKVDMSALGNWITQVQDQPLALDTIYIYSPDQKVEKVHDSLLDSFVHMVKTLYYSFVIDYNTIGNVAKADEQSKAITVWIGSGRDQANVLKQLIDETFTPKTNINVNVQLVDMGTLLQATLSGQGPDVAIQVGNDLPMNYGLRNAVVDLTEFSDLEEVKSQFRASAMVPYEFNGQTFALPETETCLMMFYRKDILDELNLKVPETWDEMKVALSVLSKNQMDLGMLPSDQVFNMLLYQNGGTYYNEDATASALGSDVAVRSFKEYCEFYSDYKIDFYLAVDQRFRTGEAPIIIADYTLYNQLQVSAPDIKGLWGFSMVPGTVREDGTVDHSVSSAGSATIMMQQTKDKASSWEFMKWWISTDTQIQYGREMEDLMGSSARYPTANVKAFDSLPWPSDDYDALKSQFEWMKGVPQVPGGYYSWRNVNNAYYRVVAAAANKKMQPREALTEFVRYINDEITFKRIEFGLPTAENTTLSDKTD